MRIMLAGDLPEAHLTRTFNSNLHSRVPSGVDLDGIDDKSMILRFEIYTVDDLGIYGCFGVKNAQV